MVTNSPQHLFPDLSAAFNSSPIHRHRQARRPFDDCTCQRRPCDQFTGPVVDSSMQIRRDPKGPPRRPNSDRGERRRGQKQQPGRPSLLRPALLSAWLAGIRANSVFASGKFAADAATFPEATWSKRPLVGCCRNHPKHLPVLSPTTNRQSAPKIIQKSAGPSTRRDRKKPPQSGKSAGIVVEIFSLHLPQ
jgi:hypothetical protein